MPDPLSSPEAYQAFIYTLSEHFPSTRRSTLVYVPSGELFGRVEGILFFDEDVVLCVQEYLNFELGVIEGYGYEASRALVSPDNPDFPVAAEYCQASYPHKEKLYWYDSQEHPNEPALASTHPHHKHVPPDIKHNRVPAPGLSFTQPNLGLLIDEIEKDLIQQRPGSAP